VHQNARPNVFGNDKGKSAHRSDKERISYLLYYGKRRRAAKEIGKMNEREYGRRSNDRPENVLSAFVFTLQNKHKNASSESDLLKKSYQKTLQREQYNKINFSI
jgi:hypothetical protein